MIDPVESPRPGHCSSISSGGSGLFTGGEKDGGRSVLLTRTTQESDGPTFDRVAGAMETSQVLLMSSGESLDYGQQIKGGRRPPGE